MCTVTYVPAGNGCIITSNRDEQMDRGVTTQPQEYWHGGKPIVYPKDAKGSGTWIGCNDNNAVAVLLNGAFEKHQQRVPYRHSRGLIIPAVLQQKNPLEALHDFNLLQIEPFTLVLYFNQSVFECRWNGNSLFTAQLDVREPYCWNSVTLYDAAVQNENNRELKTFWTNNHTAADVLDFHQRKKYELQLSPEKRIPGIRTISISQIVMGTHHSFTYHDLLRTSLL